MSKTINSRVDFWENKVRELEQLRASLDKKLTEFYRGDSLWNKSFGKRRRSNELKSIKAEINECDDMFADNLGKAKKDKDEASTLSDIKKTLKNKLDKVIADLEDSSRQQRSLERSPGRRRL